MAIKLPSRGDIVSFQLVENNINGGERIDVIVDAVDVGYNTAIRVDPEINVKHKNLFPHFSSKVNGNDDPNSYDYMILKGRNGQLEVIGVPWILDSSFSIIDARRATINIENWRQEWDAPVRTFLAGLRATFVIEKQNK